MTPPRPNPRRSGKALRKNVPPSKPVPPPSATPLQPRAAPQDPDAWTNSPPPRVLEKLVDEGLAYRYRKRPASEAPPPVPRKRVRFSEPAPWEERNPRSAAMLSRKIHTTPVSYARLRHAPYKIPHVQGSMQENEDFATNAIVTTLAGRSVAIAFGMEPENDALELMSSDEKRMYQCWKSGVKLPAENWQEMDGQLEEGADRALWERRAKDLNRIYEVTTVDSGKAQAWWNASWGWRPLLLAYGKVRQAQIDAERCRLHDVFDRIGAHVKWVRASTTRSDSNIERAMSAVDMRLKMLGPEFEQIGTPPNSPSAQGGSPQCLAEASPATDSREEMPITLATDLDSQENSGPAGSALQAPPTEALASSLPLRASAPNHLSREAGVDTDSQQEVQVTRSNELRVQPTETLMTGASLSAGLQHQTDAGNEADGTQNMQVNSVPGCDLVRAEPAVDQTLAQLADTLLYIPSRMAVLQQQVPETGLGADAGTEGQIPRTRGSQAPRKAESPPQTYRK